MNTSLSHTLLLRGRECASPRRDVFGIGRLAALWQRNTHESDMCACLCRTPPRNRAALSRRTHLGEDCLEAAFAATSPHLWPILKLCEDVSPCTFRCKMPATLGVRQISCTMGKTEFKLIIRYAGFSANSVDEENEDAEVLDRPASSTRKSSTNFD